jgi:hypothetical protein
MPLESIVTISADALEPGTLLKLFHDGAKAVVITDDERVLQLWQNLVLGGEHSNSPAAETPPWLGSFSDLARNHFVGGDISPLRDAAPKTDGAAPQHEVTG